jgi:hypothetical protein
VIGGAIAALIGLRHLVLPSSTGFPPFDTSRAGVRSILGGLTFVLPGIGFAWWHLREARRTERRFVPGAFWGRPLYFHLVAFVAGIIALGGSVAFLMALRDAAYSACPQFGALPPGVSPPFAPGCGDTLDQLRSALDALIIVLVAGVVWWWHLREARKLAPAPAVPETPAPSS